MTTPTAAPAPMRVLRLKLRFLTPAFLGDAEQNGRWRTPPFKAQLRQWWRVAYAADHGFSVNVADMRREEGLLFGNAWLSHQKGGREIGDHTKSLVRLRLHRWDKGKLSSWDKLEQGTVFHPETHKTGNRVGPHAYLGYGPLDARGGTKLAKANAAIQAEEVEELFVAWPETFPSSLRECLSRNGAPPIWPEKIDIRMRYALWLMDRYGAIGGRSRNGWGSYALESAVALTKAVPLRDWKKCLDRDWPHAIGCDEKGPLIWETEPHPDWKALMKTLAIVKIGLRTQFAFPPVKPPHANIERRHWLSYPITTHTTRAWDRSARLPNQLRFKVRRIAGDKLVGVIFHVPHLLPAAFRPDRGAIEKVWLCVHQFLDALTKPPAQRRYCDAADAGALAKQKLQLDPVMLKRVTE